MRFSRVVSSWLCWFRARKRASSQKLREKNHTSSNQNGAIDWDKPFSASTFSSLFRKPSVPSSPLMHDLAVPSIQMVAHSNHATSLEPHVHDHAAIVIQCAFRMFHAKSRLNIRSSSVGTPMSWLRRKDLIKIPSPALTRLKKRALVFSNAIAFWSSNSCRTAFTTWRSLCMLIKSSIQKKLSDVTLFSAKYSRQRIMLSFCHWSSVMKISAKSLLAENDASIFRKKRRLPYGLQLLVFNRSNECHYLDTVCRIFLYWKKINLNRIRNHLSSTSVRRVKSLPASQHFDLGSLSLALRLWVSRTVPAICLTNQRLQLAWNRWRFGSMEMSKEITSMDLLLPPRPLSATSRTSS